MRSAERLGKVSDWLTYESRAPSPAALEGQVPRSTAEMVRLALHRQRRRDRRPAPRRRPQSGVRGMALGADENARPRRAVQTAGLRARGGGFRQVRPANR